MHKPRRVRGSRVPFAGSVLTAPPEITDFLTNVRLVTQSYANHISYLRSTSSFLVGPLISLLSIGFALNKQFRIAQQISLLPPGNRTQKRVQTRSTSITSMYPSVADNIPLQLAKTQLSSLKKVLNQFYENKLNYSTLKKQGNKGTVSLAPTNIYTIQSSTVSGRVDELSNNTILDEMISPLGRAIRHSFSVGHAPFIALTRSFGSKSNAARRNSYSYWYFRTVELGFERHFPDLFSKKQLLTNNLYLVRSSLTELLAQAAAMILVTTMAFSTSQPTIIQSLSSTGHRDPSTQIVGTLPKKSKGHREQSTVIKAFSTFTNLVRILPVDNVFLVKGLETMIRKDSFPTLAGPNKFGWSNIEQSGFLSTPTIEQAYSRINLPSVSSRKISNPLSKLANNSLPLTTILKLDGEMQVTHAIQFMNNSSQQTLNDANLKMLPLLINVGHAEYLLPFNAKNSQSRFYGNLKLLGSFKQIDSLVGQLNSKIPQPVFYRNSSQPVAIPVTTRFISKHESLMTVAKALTKWVGNENLALEKLAQNKGFNPFRIISDHTNAHNLSYLPFKSVYRFPHQHSMSVILNSIPSIKKLITSLDFPTLTIAPQTTANAQMMATSHLTRRSITMQKMFRENKSTFSGLSNNFNFNPDQNMIELPSWESSNLQQPNIMETGNITKNPSFPNDAQYEVKQRYEQDSEIRSFQTQIERILSEELIKFDASHDNGLPAAEFSRFNIDDNVSEINARDDKYDEEMEIKTLKRKIEQLLEEELRRHGYIPW